MIIFSVMCIELGRGILFRGGFRFCVDSNLERRGNEKPHVARRRFQQSKSVPDTGNRARTIKPAEEYVPLT